jgi:hypothetical protein
MGLVNGSLEILRNGIKMVFRILGCGMNAWLIKVLSLAMMPERIQLKQLRCFLQYFNVTTNKSEHFLFP